MHSRRIIQAGAALLAMLGVIVAAGGSASAAGNSTLEHAIVVTPPPGWQLMASPDEPDLAMKVWGRYSQGEMLSVALATGNQRDPLSPFETVQSWVRASCRKGAAVQSLPGVPNSAEASCSITLLTLSGFSVV